MSHYYPQAACRLRVLWEDFGLTDDPNLKREYLLDVLCKRVNVNINDYVEADTFDIDIEYNSFPFDPRTMRAVGVSIYIQDMRKLFKSNGAPIRIRPSADNIMFQGFADESGIILDDGSQTVRIEGRDFTGLFIDAPFDKREIPLTDNVEAILRTLVKGLPATASLTVVNRTGETLPTLAEFAPDFKPFGTTKSKKKNEKYWDVIQDLVARAGLIAFVEIDKLVISKPRALYNKANARQFIYGANLKQLDFKRKLGRQKGFNVVVRSLDFEKGEVVEAKIPEEATALFTTETGIAAERVQVDKQNTDGSIKKEDAPFLSFLIPNIVKKEHLVAVGEKIFEEVSRQEIEGSLTTKEMRVRQGTNKFKAVEFDLLKIRNGTPIDVTIEKDDQKQLNRLTSISAKVRYLRSRGFQAEPARALAKTLGKITTTFYTKSVDFTLDQEDGFSLKIDFINFIELPNRILSVDT